MYSRPRKEVDGKTEEEIKATREFQLTTSQGGRRNFFFDSATLHIFQLTTSQGGRLLQLLSLPIPDLHFNSRPREEVDVFAPGRRKKDTHFNSQPREEVDGTNLQVEAGTIISTHDLTRRSTFTATFSADTGFAFQLTTSQGGRRYCRKALLHNQHFNSRPHKEVDDGTASYRDKHGRISTHDLTKRSTCICHYSSCSSKFQLTTSRRGRQLAQDRMTDAYVGFNSRPHEEVDAILLPFWRLNIVSTHDLTKRSTLTIMDTETDTCSFNSRPHEEVDDMGLWTEYKKKIFQLTTSRGGRLLLSPYICHLGVCETPKAA